VSQSDRQTDRHTDMLKQDYSSSK